MEKDTNTKNKNINLHTAKGEKKDEFYTQLNDIENELKHYKAHFKDKVVYCNCDDPLASNFFKYFFLNFKHLGLKELITTCYKSQNFREFSSEDSPKKAYCIRIHDSQAHSNPAQVSLNELENLLEVELNNEDRQSTQTEQNFEKNKHRLESKTYLLKPDRLKSKSLFYIFEDENLGNAGDFRSSDCIELLKQADIVVTNPPFSLFREYVAQLMEFDKKFVIIMPLNAITYKEVFKFIRANKLWLGYGFKAGNAYFKVRGKSGNEFAKGVYDEETGLVKFRNVTWATNLDIKKRHEPLETIHFYSKSPEKYPKYDNYNAINVDKTAEIPMDYEGIMGVPITFLDKYNPEQFELLGLDNHLLNDGLGKGCNSIKGKKIYRRLIIKNKIPKKNKK